MTEMQQDAGLARRVQAAENRKKPRPDDERDGGVRPRAMKEDVVESSQLSAAPCGNGNRDQSGSCEVQAEGQA